MAIGVPAEKWRVQNRGHKRGDAYLHLQPAIVLAEEYPHDAGNRDLLRDRKSAGLELDHVHRARCLCRRRERDRCRDGRSRQHATAPSYYEWFPEGTASGKPRYYGSGYVSDKNVDAATPGNVLTDFTVASVFDVLGTSTGS